MKKLTLFFGLLLLAVIQPALADCPIYPSLNNPTYQAFYPPGLSAQVTISGKIVAFEPYGYSYWCDPSYANRINIYDNGKLAKTLTGVWYNGYSFSTTVEFGVGLHEVRVEACRDSTCGSSTIYVEVISDGIQKSCTVWPSTSYSSTLYVDIPREGHRLKVYPGQGMGVYGWIETSTSLRGQNIGVGMYVYVDGVYKGVDGGTTKYDFIDLGNGRMRSYVAVTVGDLTPGSHTATIIHYGYNGATCSFTVNFTVEYLNPTVLKVNPSSSSNKIVGAPGSWCRYAGGNNYICGDKSGVVAYELDDTARKATPIQRNDPKVSTLSNVITRLYYLYSDTCDDLGWYCYRTYYDYVYYIGLSSAQLWIYPLNPNPSYSSRDAAGYDTMSIPIKIKSSGNANMLYVSIINLQTGRKEVHKLDMSVYYNTKEVQTSLTPSSKSYLVQISYRATSGTYATGYQGTISSSIVSTANPPKAIPGAVIISNVPKYSCSNDDNSGFQVDPKTTAVLYSGGYASLSTQLYYCKYTGTAVLASTYAIPCCRVSDEVLPLPVKAEPLGVGDTVGIVYCINEACQASSCTGLSPGTQFSGSKQVLIPVSNTINPDYWGAVTGTVSTAGYQIPPPNSNPFTSTPYLTFPDLAEHPATEQGITFKNLPLFQAMLPVKITYGCAKDTWNQPCNDEPHAGFYSGIAICKPSDIRVNGQSYYLDPSNRGGLKAFLINPVDNKPGARNNTSITIEYFSVEGRVATRHTIPVTVERGYAFVEGSNFNLIFNIDTTSPITGAWMQNGSQNITGEILDAKTARFPWTGKRYNETWTVRVCNAEGKCNQTYVTVLGTAPADVPVYSTPVPVPGSLYLGILYPQNGASVPPGSLTARAEAYVSGGYGRVTSVDFYFAIYDPNLGSYRTVCGVTRTSPDTGNEYRATCILNEPGEYMLSVFARDSNGNNAAKSVRFTAGGGGSGGGGSGGGSGSQPPTITQFNYPMYCINDGSSVTVTFSASAPNGLKEARLYADGQLATSKSLSGTSANNVQMTFRAAFNGKQSITIRLVIEDTAGLTAEASGLLVACSRCPDQPPVVNIIQPNQQEYLIEEGRNTYLLPVTVSYSDDSAVKRLELYINNQYYFGIDLDSKSGTIAISPDIVQIELPQGNYTLKAVVKDSCNQIVETTKDVSIHKENIIPLYWNAAETSIAGGGTILAPATEANYDKGTLNYEKVEYDVHYTGYLRNALLTTGEQLIPDARRMGSLDKENNTAYIEWPCENVPGDVVWFIEPGTKYQFKAGCCRYECPPDWQGAITGCVRVC
jgi:uncharacterized membrane protein YgcG